MREKDQLMRKRLIHIIVLGLFIIVSAFGVSAQQPAKIDNPQRKPSEAKRPVVVMSAQSLEDLKQKLKPGNKTEELIDSAGMELRVAVQHENNKTGAAAELHDASDDVYYVLEGAATLVLGGTLDALKKSSPANGAARASLTVRRLKSRKATWSSYPAAHRINAALPAKISQ